MIAGPLEYVQLHRADPALSAVLSSGAITAWHRNSTVGAVSTYPDLLGGAAGIPGPAGSSHFPTGQSDFTLVFDGGDDIRIALAAPNNGTQFWGFGVWIKPSLSAQQTLYNAQASSGASSTKARIDVMTNGSVQAVSLTSGTAASSAGALSSSVAKFLSVEFNGTRSAGSRLKFFVDDIDVTSSDSSPAALNAPTGNSEIFAQDASGGGTSFIGTAGRSFYFYGAAMSGSTSGLLTVAGRAALRRQDGFV